MNKLESFNSERIYWAVEQVEQEPGDIDELHLDDNLFYIKSEVDKVIAELKEETEKLKATPEQIMKEVFDKCLIYPKEMVRLDDAYKLVVSLRNQKYKRCLDKAKYCEERDCYLSTLDYVEMTNREYRQVARGYWSEWHKRWLELAEKFKETK